MTRPVCVKCGIEMVPECNDTATWHPCEPEIQGKDLIDVLRYGDIYKCPKCGYEIVTGFGSPFYAHNTPQSKLKQRRDHAERSVKFYFEAK